MKTQYISATLTIHASIALKGDNNLHIIHREEKDGDWYIYL